MPAQQETTTTTAIMRPRWPGDPRRPAQRRDRRARRPRQDHAGRRDALAVRRVRRARRTSTSGPWTPATSSARRASRSSRRTPRSLRDRRPDRSTSSTPPATPTSAARSSAACRWSTASCCSSTRARARCRRPASCCARRSRPSCPSSWSSTRSTAPTPASPRSSTRLLRAVPRPATPSRGADRVPDRLRRRPRPAGPRSTGPRTASMPDSEDLEPLFDTILETVPAPVVRRRGARCRPTSPTSTPRRSSAGSRCCRVHNGTSSKGQQVAWCKHDGTIERVKITELLITEALERKPAESAGPGDIVAIAGIPEITIGETLADPDDPRPLPLITVDEPAISMTIGTNTSPLVGREQGHQGHRPPGQGPPRPRAGRQRVAAGAARPSVRTPGRSRAAASSRWPSWSSRCAARASS